MKGLIGLLVVIWLVIGAVAAFQRGYFGDTALTIVAGPLNYVGVNPKIKCAEAPEPSR
jgi:hypothetical protein